MLSLKVEAFCNTFDLHEAIIGLENQFLVLLRVAVLHRCNCNWAITLKHNKLSVHPVYTHKRLAGRSGISDDLLCALKET